MNQELRTLFIDAVGDAQQIMLVLPQQASPDQVGTALSLASGIEQLGKQAFLAAPLDPTEMLRDSSLNPDDFIGIESIQTQIGNKDLRVSFPYSEEQVDKVNYQIDEDQGLFHLTISPQSGVLPLDTSAVSFSYEGVQADLIFLIGIHDLETIGEMHREYADFFAQTRTVTLHRFQPDIGDIHLVTDRSFAETCYELLQQLQVAMDSDMATNLLRGIEDTTNHLQSLSTKPETFEVVAELLRAGARRRPRREMATVVSESPQSHQPVVTPAASVSSNGEIQTGSNPFADALGKPRS